MGEFSTSNGRVAWSSFGRQNNMEKEGGREKRDAVRSSPVCDCAGGFGLVWFGFGSGYGPGRAWQQR